MDNRPELSAEENLNGFIQFCRNGLHVFGRDLKFDENEWDITDRLHAKGEGRMRTRINFYTFKDSETSAQIPIRGQFNSFSKAYVRYMLELRPMQLPYGKLYALKALALALDTEKNSSDVDKLDDQVFNRAGSIIQGRFAKRLAYRVGRELEQLGKFLTIKVLTVTPIHWNIACMPPALFRRTVADRLANRMASAAVFCPRPELSAEENLNAYVQFCKNDLHVFGSALPFDEDVWDVTDYLDLKGRGNKKTRINFYGFSDSDESAQIPIREPFNSFSKAYVRNMHGLRPKKFPHGRLYALKALALALDTEKNSSDVGKLDDQIFNRAGRIIQDRFTEGLAYRVGKDLEQLGKFLAKKMLTEVPLHWKSFLPRPADTDRVGEEFDERRAEKMPSEAALDALPRMYNLAKDCMDVIFMSIIALLLSSPDRISEAELLPENCEVELQHDGEADYGLRWWPSKGGRPMIKPLYSGMAEITRGAIARIKAVTAPARAIALWYEQNPSKVYLAPELEPLRQREWITVSEVAQILGFSGAPAGLRWCQDNKLTIQPKRGATLARFVEVEQRIISMLPQGFPFLSRELGLLYSKALIVVRKNEIHAEKRTYACMIEPVATDAINRAFGSKHQRSLFEKFGFSEPDGSRIRVTTHTFRHYLHTIGKMGGLSESDLAKWAGRIDLRQNQAYNHVTPDQMLAKMRNAVGDKSLMFGPLGKAPEKRLIRRSEFAELKIPTAHVTKIGFCVHAYVQSPCQIHRDCINCEELVCVKGDAEKNEEVKRQLSEARLLLEKAEQASSGGYCGSDRWVVHQKATVERLSQLSAILEDPTVPPGSFISLTRPHAKNELDSKSSRKRKRTEPRKRLTGGENH